MTRGFSPPLAHRVYEISGTVQGIGLRPAIARLAQRLALVGSVRNVAAGVRVEAHGSPAQLAAFEHELLRHVGPDARLRPLPMASGSTAPASFTIAASIDDGTRVLASSPDLATCDACLADIADPATRRFGYALTTCCTCGPRFSIATGHPYDRATTTLAEFPLCADCRREYDDPSDRRYHAETIACPRCGPRLSIPTQPQALAPLDDAVAALRRGAIVAIKGSGGFHLACDARDTHAVDELRRRKRRPSQPFAVLIADASAADSLAYVDAGEHGLLAAPERPIVLVRARPDHGMAAAIAPGTNLLGLLLPYTPLHHQLAQRFGAPLVLTSANAHGEPMPRSLAEFPDGLADVVVDHDRAIRTRCDDSVVRWIAGGPVLLRRSRGYVPRPLPLAAPCAVPVLGLGGNWKNTFCVAVGERAYLGPHVGDLDSPEAEDAWIDAVDHFLGLLNVEPQVVVHDLHPAYATTRLAQRWPHAEAIAVQHHHAHVVAGAVAAGLALDEPFWGIAFDGTGDGGDGSAWGGEILLADGASFARRATLRPLHLVGGERAIEEIGRLAVAALFDAYDGNIPERAAALVPLADARQANVIALLQADVACTPAHGAGRYFDAVAALLGLRSHAEFDGQPAMELEALAGADAAPEPYPFDLASCGPLLSIDLRPCLRAIVDERLAGVAPRRSAARFHRTLAVATAAAWCAVAGSDAARPIVLAGGCMQNRRFTEDLIAAFDGAASVHLPRSVPLGDGGLALGQALVAAARTRQARDAAARAMPNAMQPMAEKR